MRLVDAPLDAAAVAGTFSELRLAAEALPQSQTAIVVKHESRRGGVGHWIVVAVVCVLEASQQISIKGSYTARTLFVRASLAKHGRRRIARARRGVCKAGFACDDAPRAVPSDARHDGWYGPDGRENLATHTHNKSTASPTRWTGKSGNTHNKAQHDYAGLLIGRLTALSLDSVDRDAWQFVVDGIICLVTSVSVCTEKERKRDKRG